MFSLCFDARGAQYRAFFVLIRAAYELVVLRQGSSGLAEGDLDYKFPTESCTARRKNA